MALEIERRFLVKDVLRMRDLGDWRESDKIELIRQGYLTDTPDIAIRIRLIYELHYLNNMPVQGKFKEAILTIKYPRNSLSQLVRCEYEWPIEKEKDAFDLYKKCIYKISKIRHYLTHDKVSDIDFVLDLFTKIPIIIIEMEMKDETFKNAEYGNRDVFEEVTDDPRYSNFYLAKHFSE